MVNWQSGITFIVSIKYYILWYLNFDLVRECVFTVFCFPMIPNIKFTNNFQTYHITLQMNLFSFIEVKSTIYWKTSRTCKINVTTNTSDLSKWLSSRCLAEFTLREKCPYSEFFWSVFSRIRAKDKEILRISPHSIQMPQNTDQNNSEYGHFSRNVKLGLS